MTGTMRRPLRFCMITTFYPPYNFGGDGIFVQRLSNELADRGHSVDVVHSVDAYRLAAPAPAEPGAGHPGVTVHGLTTPMRRLATLATHQTGSLIPYGKRIRQILSGGFDVIHYHNVSLVGGAAVLALGDGPVKLCTMHDYWLVCPTHALFRNNREACMGPPGCFSCQLAHRRPPQLWRYTPLMQRSLRHVDAFIAPSMTSQRKHEQLGLRGRIVHIPNFVSTADDDPAPSPANGANGRRPYFLYTGRLERLKGLQDLVPSFTRYGKAELWIAGAGTEEAALRALVHDHPNIRLLGHRSGRELEALNRGAVAVVYPSVNHQVGIAGPSVRSGQGAPLVFMEAFSQRTPVIASRLGSIPALLEDTGGGLVYGSESELFEILDRLVENPEYRRELGLRGYHAFRERWTADAHIERYLALIDGIVQQREPGAH